MQWHPLFAKLVRPLLEGYYEVQTNVPVGDAPRAADLVLVRRTSNRALPFRGLWKHLTAWNVLEYKGPTVSARVKDLPLLVELGLGIRRRLNEERDKQERSTLEPRDVSFWYLANHLGARFLKRAEALMRGLELVAEGLWRGYELGHTIYLASSRELPVELDSLPLHVLARESQETKRAVARLIVAQATLWPTFGEMFAGFHPEILEEILDMAKTATKKKEEFKFHWDALFKFSGKEEVVKALEGIIGFLGKKKVLEHLTVDDLVANLSAEERKELKRRLAE
jgi:hypothetical protein